MYGPVYGSLAVCTEFALQTSLWLASQTANLHNEPYLLCCYYTRYSRFFLSFVLKINSEARSRGIVCEQELGDFA